MKRKVVFDLDDVLWPLNYVACQLLNIDYSKMVTFGIGDKSELTADEYERLTNLFEDPELWKHIKWEEKALDIYKLERYNAEIYIDSNCKNQDVADFKRSFLSNTLQIPDERIILNVTQSPKVVKSDTFIFVDDLMTNIQNSRATHNIMPTKLWNRPFPNVYRFVRFKDIYNFIEMLLREE